MQISRAEDGAAVGRFLEQVSLVCLCAQRGRSAGVVKVVEEGGGSARRGGRIRLPSLLSLPAGDNGALAAGVDGDTGPPLRAGALLLPVGWLCASLNHMTCNTPTPPTGSLCVCACVYLRCVQCRIWITFRTMHSFFRFCCPAVPSSGGEDEHLSLFIL